MNRHAIVDALLGRAGGATPLLAGTSPAIVAPMYSPSLTSSTIVGLSAVWRCVSLIADAAADCPWSEWDGDDESPTRVAPSRLVLRPMVTMSRREFTWRVIATEALHSTAHLLHVGGYDTDGVPWSLLPLPPASIMPADPPDPWGLTQPTRYYVGGQIVGVDDLTIIRRAPWPGLEDRLAGILSIARAQFASYLAADYVAARYWRAGGPVVTQITSDQILDDTDAAKAAQRWADRRLLGGDFPVVLGKGMEAKPWGADPTSEAAVEARREIVADVGRYFGVPTRILNAPAGDSETYSNVENEAVDLYRYTLRGYMGPLEDGISELLPGDYTEGRRMRLDPTRLLQGDLASRAIAYPALVGAEIMDIDEARRLGFGLGPRGSSSETADPTPRAIPAAFATALED